MDRYLNGFARMVPATATCEGDAVYARPFRPSSPGEWRTLISIKRRGRRHARSGAARLTLSPSLARSVQKDSAETIVNPPKVMKARCKAVMTARRSDCGRSPRYHAATSDPKARPKLMEIC